jgi:RNA-directed DNA polymerase
MRLLDQLAMELGIEHAFIEAVASSASFRYKTYKVAKRTGGKREICHPSKELKALQRWLALRVLSGFPVHDAATAYRPGRSIVFNARRHLGSRFLLRLDFKDFFPSLTRDDVLKHLEWVADRGLVPAVSEWTAEDRELFARIVCRNGRLTIGAVSSPALSNTLSIHLDSALAEYCAAQGVTYTRYADDLFLSTVRPNVLRQALKRVAAILSEIPYPSKLALNKTKVFHSSQRGRRVVTGIVLTSCGEISLGRERKRLVQAMIHRWERLSGSEKASLAGLLAYCRSVEPDFINRLVLKYDVDRVRRALRGA